VLFTDVFRGIPGVRVEPGPAGYVIRSARAVSLGGGVVRTGPGGGVPGDDGPGKPITGGDCPPAYYVDGIPRRLGGALDGEFSTYDIEGVEIYFGNVPPQWGGSQAMCGVIVIWTRTNAAPASSH
jgi:hypothetical protein